MRLLSLRRIRQSVGLLSSTQSTGRNPWQLITSVRNMVSKALKILDGARGTPLFRKKWDVFLNSLSDLVDMGINVVLTAHAQIKKFEQTGRDGFL